MLWHSKGSNHEEHNTVVDIRFTFQRHDKNCGRGEKSARPRRRCTSSERCVADTLRNRSLSSPPSYVTSILGFVLCHTINDQRTETKKNEKLQKKFFLRNPQKHRLSKFEESFILNFFLTVACALSSFSLSFCRIINDAFMHQSIALFMEFNIVSPLLVSGHRVAGAGLPKVGRVLRHPARLHRTDHLAPSHQQRQLQRHRSREDQEARTGLHLAGC